MRTLAQRSKRTLFNASLTQVSEKQRCYSKERISEIMAYSLVAQSSDNKMEIFIIIVNNPQHDTRPSAESEHIRDNCKLLGQI